MQHKSFNIMEAKADGKSGTFEALVSVFGNVDHDGDRIKQGAFTKTLKRWQGVGDPIPVILSHQWSDPWAHIGVVRPEDAKQTDHGLWVKGKLDVEDNEVARQVYRLMKRRSLKEFSFGFQVPDGGQNRAKDGINEISEIDLAEIGPTLKGANPATELGPVKSAIRIEQAKVEPPSEDEQRKRMQAITLEEGTKDVPPETPPAPDPEVVKLEARLEKLSAELVEAQKPAPAPPPSEEDQRKRVQAMQLEEETKGVPEDTPPAPDPLSVEIEAIKQRLEELVRQPPAPPATATNRTTVPTEAKLRQEDQAKRLAEADVPDVPAGPSETELLRQQVKALEESLETSMQQMADLVKQQPPTEAQLRSQAQELRLAEATRDVPEGTESAPDPVTELQGRVEDLSKQMGEFMGAVGKQLEGIRDAVQEPARVSARSHDPLRARSDQAVLEIESDGISLRKSPTAKPEPTPEPPSQVELRTRSNLEMLELLTGVPNDKE